MLTSGDHVRCSHWKEDMTKLFKRLIVCLLATVSFTSFSVTQFATSAAEAEPAAVITYKNVLNGRCLANWTLGDFAGTGTCGTDPYTGWTLRRHDVISPSYLIQNTRTGGCLQRRTDGAVISAACNHSIDAQVWTIPYDGNAFIIQGQFDGCLGVNGPTGVHFWASCNGGDTHNRWR